MKKPFYCTYGEIWEPYMTSQERIEAMERELRDLNAQLAWSIDHVKRLQVAIAEKQEQLDLEVAEVLKHK